MSEFEKPFRSRAPEALSSLRTGLFVRTLALAKLALTTKRDLFWQENLRQFDSDPELRQQIESQAREIARELGTLKGSAMKVGQLLSIFGEHFLPPQVNSVLKLLQADSPPLEWQCIEPTLRNELGAHFDDLEIEPNAFSAASIGQVHRARIKATGESIVLKIQYPNVERAIENDIRALKTLLLFAPGPFRGERTNQLLREVEEMLARETDYLREAENYSRIKDELRSDSRFIVPRVHKSYSSSRVLALDYMIGERMDSPAIANLSQDRRNYLGQAMLDLYLRELFYLGRVQTDAHIGNFLVAISDQPNVESDKIILLDFGAMRDFSNEFLTSYAGLVRAAMAEDRDAISKMGTEIGFLKTCDPEAVHQEFYKFCRLVVEPFGHQLESYCWNDNDLPKRLAAQLNQVIQAREFRPPPREALFLDRKSTGLFCLLSKLGAKTKSRELVEKAITYRLAQVSVGSTDESVPTK